MGDTILSSSLTTPGPPRTRIERYGREQDRRFSRRGRPPPFGQATWSRIGRCLPPLPVAKGRRGGGRRSGRPSFDRALVAAARVPGRHRPSATRRAGEGAAGRALDGMCRHARGGPESDRHRYSVPSVRRDRRPRGESHEPVDDHRFRTNASNKDTSLFLRGIGHFHWVVRNLPNVRRMYREHAINFSLQPKLVLLAPQFSLVVRSVARQVTCPQVQWVRYHTVDSSGGPAVLLEPVVGD